MATVYFPNKQTVASIVACVERNDSVVRAVDLFRDCGHYTAPMEMLSNIILYEAIINMGPLWWNGLPHVIKKQVAPVVVLKRCGASDSVLAGFTSVTRLIDSQELLMATITAAGLGQREPSALLAKMSNERQSFFNSSTGMWQVSTRANRTIESVNSVSEVRVKIEDESKAKMGSDLSATAPHAPKIWDAPGRPSKANHNSAAPQPNLQPRKSKRKRSDEDNSSHNGIPTDGYHNQDHVVKRIKRDLEDLERQTRTKSKDRAAKLALIKKRRKAHTESLHKFVGKHNTAVAEATNRHKSDVRALKTKLDNFVKSHTAESKKIDDLIAKLV